MYSDEAVINGIIKYIDNEILAKSGTMIQWLGGALVSIASQKADDIADSLADSKVARTLGIMDEAGNYDVDMLATELKKAAAKYGKMEFTLPIINQKMAFTSNDIDLLRDYIIGRR